jgi:hypothetical protein
MVWAVLDQKTNVVHIHVCKHTYKTGDDTIITLNFLEVDFSLCMD